MSGGCYSGILMISDLDGTLLNKAKQITVENRLAIERFADNGGLFTIATGRIAAAVKRFLPDLPLNAPAILYNGGMIYDFRREAIIWDSFLPETVVEFLAGLWKVFPEIGIEVYRGGGLVFANRNQETARHLQREQFPEIDAELTEIPLPWQKVLLAWEPARIDEVELYLKKSKLPCSWVRSEREFIELLPPGISKGLALQKLALLLEIPLKNVIAMGDNLNDLEMIETAGIGIAVANAHPELLKKADLVGVDHGENAIAQVVEALSRREIAV